MGCAYFFCRSSCNFRGPLWRVRIRLRKRYNVKTLIERGRQAKEPEKYDEKPTYKMFLGYSSGVVVIGDVIVGIENRDANTNVRFKQKETLERIFKQLKASGVQCFSTPYG